MFFFIIIILFIYLFGLKKIFWKFKKDIKQTTQASKVFKTFLKKETILQYMMLHFSTQLSRQQNQRNPTIKSLALFYTKVTRKTTDNVMESSKTATHR